MTNIDAGLVRRCGWPGCPRWYDAGRGPEDRGWTRQLHKSLVLCPHHTSGRSPQHWPDFEMKDGGGVTGTCSCGAREDVTPTNIQAVIDWWTGHILALPDSQTPTSPPNGATS